MRERSLVFGLCFDDFEFHDKSSGWFKNMIF